MDTFGRFRLAFEPSEDDMAPAVEMTISGEADLSQMASFFDSFLKANGYLYEGKLEIVDKKKEDSWGSPYDYITVGGSQAVDFVPFSSVGSDVISFK
jgi:hypothetical protein